MVRSLLGLIAFFIFCSVQAAEEGATNKLSDATQKLVASGNTIVTDLNVQRSEFELLRRQIEVAKGENRISLEIQFQQKALKALDLMFSLTDILQKQNDLGLDTVELRDEVVSYMISTSNALDHLLDVELDKNIQRRSERTNLTGFQLIEFERTNADALGWIKTLFEKKMRFIRELDSLGLKFSNHLENLLNRLEPYADNLAGQIKLLNKEKVTLELSTTDEPPSAETRSQILALQTRETATLSALSAVVIMLDENEIDSTIYRQLLLKTGQVSIDLFNPEIVLGLLKQNLIEKLDSFKNNFGFYVTQSILFLGILLTFKIVATVTNFLLRKSFESRRVETSRLMREMLLSLSSRGIMILGLLVALNHVGVQITALLTGLGIVGFILGFALQDSLANFAAGMMILGYRPFDVADIIEAGGVIGKVSKMSLVSTTILTFDNQTLIVPNNKIWGDVIKNITLQAQRRIDLEFRVAYTEDVSRVKDIIEGIIKDNEKILDDPSPTVQMDQLSPYAMVFVVRPWVMRSDYWPTRWELLRVIKEKLDKEGVKIPVLNQGVIEAV
jgi:small conductance mechanosensitive channel